MPNTTDQRSPSVIQRFVENVHRFPERPALWAGGEARSYATTSRVAAAILEQLRTAGLGDAPRIGIVTGDDFHTYAAILAILANGSAYVPLNKHNPVARNLVVAKEADLAAVVSTSAGELRAALHQQHGSDLPWIDAVVSHSDDGELLRRGVPRTSRWPTFSSRLAAPAHRKECRSRTVTSTSSCR